MSTFTEAQFIKGVHNLPEIESRGKISSVLATQIQIPRITEIIKFGAFSPAFSSTQSFQGSLLKSETIKPITETKFKSIVTRQGDLSSVNVAGTVAFGDTKAGFVAKQLVRDADDLTVGGGAGFTAIRTGTVKEIKAFQIMGKSQQIGTASLRPQDLDLTTSFLSRAVTKDVFGFRVSSGLGLGYGSIGKVSVRKGIPSTSEITSTRLLGVLRLRDEGVLELAGTTTRAFRKQGDFSKLIVRTEDINVRGGIKVIDTSSSKKSKCWKER